MTDDTASQEAAPQEQAEPERDYNEIVYPHISEIKEPSVDVSTFNTINLQESLAEIKSFLPASVGVILTFLVVKEYIIPTENNKLKT